MDGQQDRQTLFYIYKTLMATARCQNIFKALKGIDEALEGTDTF